MHGHDAYLAVASRRIGMGYRDVHMVDTTDNNALYCFKAGEYVHAEWLQMHMAREHKTPFHACTECNKKKVQTAQTFADMCRQYTGHHCFTMNRVSSPGARSKC